MRGQMTWMRVRSPFLGLEQGRCRCEEAGKPAGCGRLAGILDELDVAVHVEHVAAARMPMLAITTSSSIRVTPPFFMIPFPHCLTRDFPDENACDHHRLNSRDCSPVCRCRQRQFCCHGPSFRSFATWKAPSWASATLFVRILADFSIGFCVISIPANTAWVRSALAAASPVS